MKLPWSISTTVRNPERLRSFLKVLKELDGEVWGSEAQIRFQIMLIRDKLYGFDNTQFRRGLTPEQRQLMQEPEPITYKQAEEIFDRKKYVDPAMRGRQSFNPLEKMGLVLLRRGKIKITALGEYLLGEDYDLGELFFRSFIKWQLPNPSTSDYKLADGYDIKPFVGTLHLIDRVNRKWEHAGHKPVGVDKEEFSLFTPTLIHHKKIEEQAQKIIDLRLACIKKGAKQQRDYIEQYKIQFAREFLGTKDPTSVKKLLSNLKDYGDNSIRYFRLTRYLYIRGGGFYVDLEPRRQVELENLLKFDGAKSELFSNEEDYLSYIADIRKPVLPWETKTELVRIVELAQAEIRTLTEAIKQKGSQPPAFALQNPRKIGQDELHKYIDKLRLYRRELREIETHIESQNTEKLEGYINALKAIYSSKNRPLELEKLTTLALNALNDALKIKPNYPVGDDNEPTFTAPANKPDIECFYESFNSVCEVTMLTNRTQWYYEGQPVMRHLRDFENDHSGKDVYCIFIAPEIHRDTMNAFWPAVKHEYEGARQRIIPLTIGQLVELLEVLLEIRKKGSVFKHTDLCQLYSKIFESAETNLQSTTWLDSIGATISEWKRDALQRK